jgi:hypothetical protein
MMILPTNLERPATTLAACPRPAPYARLAAGATAACDVRRDYIFGSTCRQAAPQGAECKPTHFRHWPLAGQAGDRDRETLPCAPCQPFLDADFEEPLLPLRRRAGGAGLPGPWARR